MNKKRDRLEIIHDILNSIREKPGVVRQTHILYKSNLSHQMLVEYVGDLIDKGFIVEKKDKKDKSYFELTAKGHNYLNDYKMIRGFVDSYGLN